MKLKFVFVLVVLLFNLVFPKVLRRLKGGRKQEPAKKSDNTSVRTNEKEISDNTGKELGGAKTQAPFDFAIGAYGAISGNPFINPRFSSEDQIKIKPVLGCFPNDWLDRTGPESPDKKEIDGVKDKYVDGLFEKFINFKYTFSFLMISYDFTITDILNMVCAYKKSVISGLSSIDVKRLFIQSNRRSKYSLRSLIKSKVNTVLTKVMKTKGIVSFIVSKIGEVFKPLMQELKNFFIQFLSNMNFIQKMLKIFDCLVKLDNVTITPEVKTIIKNFVRATEYVNKNGWEGFVYTLVNGFCEWEIFKAALYNFLWTYNNPVEKYRLLGRFYGGLAMAIGVGMGKARRRRRVR